MHNIMIIYKDIKYNSDIVQSYIYKIMNITYNNS